MNLQSLFNTDVSFVAGVPIVEKGLKDKFAKFREALCDLAFYNSEYDVYCRTIKEDWKQNTEGGSIDRTCFVHLYRFPEIALSQQKQLLKKVDKALDKKRSGRVVDRDDWNFVARFITERKEEHDGKEKKRKSGRRTLRHSDPGSALPAALLSAATGSKIRSRL